VDCGACCISSNTRFTYLFTYLFIKLGPGTRIIASGYPVPKTGNAANH